ncbi:hypothetical protein LOD99_16174 [Oopsacas minuta]|uniref:Uncharacterized protein n=1 Tax=Oopsacas minuta TaxID=111878 RepID=A0AAV7K6I2_9METZ|nr:hypothetical protein LOD99_16174 [Oopsacas minuta]
MATSTTSSINSGESTVESILQLNYTIFESLDPRNSTEISHFSKTEAFPQLTTITPIKVTENLLTNKVRNSFSPSEASTDTITYKSIAKGESMKSESSHSSSSLNSTKHSLEGMPSLHPIQVKILKELKKNLETTRDKVKKLELDNRQIPTLKKRLDQLETELCLQNISNPEDSSLNFTNLLSSSIPVSRLSSSPLSELELTPTLLLAEIYRVLNCDGTGLPNGSGASKTSEFLPPLRKILLKRINELKRNELQGATAQQKILDTLSRQVVCMNTKGEELNRKLLDFRASIKMVSTAREQITERGIAYFQDQWDCLILDKSPPQERVKKLESLCAQLQHKVDHYKNSIMFYKTENDTLITQLQPFKTASKATTSILEEVKSLRTLVKNTQKEISTRTAENTKISEELDALRGQQNERRVELEGEEKFLKMEEERDAANKLAHDCQLKVSSLSASLHQISSLMMEEKNRNDSLKKEYKEIQDNNQALSLELETKSQSDFEVSQLKSDVRHKEREIAQLLESLQRQEMTKDDLRRAERELKQYKTKSQLSENRNKELTTQMSDCVDKEAVLEDKLHSLETDSGKIEKILQSIKDLFPEPGPAMSVLDQIITVQNDLREAQELVEFLQAEKSLEEETILNSTAEIKNLEELQQSNCELREEIAEMKLTREAFLSQIETLEAQLEDRAFTIDKLQQQSEVNKAQYDMKTQDLSEQIVELDTLRHESDVQNATQRDLLQKELESVTLTIAQTKETLAIQSTELEEKSDQIEHLTQELEAKSIKAQAMMDKFFPDGFPTAQLVNEANQKLQESLTSEKEQLYKQREEHQKLEQQVSLLDTWLQQCKKDKEAFEKERNYLKDANQGKLKKIMQLEGVEQQNKQLKKELKEVSIIY